MDFDYYRLAYNIFYFNWQRFGIPEKDIPFPKTEKDDSLNLIIPGFSKAVVFFQITSRSDLKSFFDECPRVHNLIDFCTRFEKMMMKFFPEVTMQEDQSENTVETNLSEDNTDEDLSEDSKQESLSKESKKESLPEDSKKESLPEDSKKESLSEASKTENLSEDSKKGDDKIKPEEVPVVIALSLAVCTELILYQYEDNKKYMKNLPDMWVKYFNENLKNLCDEAGYSLDYLKAYSDSIQCPDNFLNKFVTENKNEYHHIRTKFNDYAKTCYAVESPEHTTFITEVGCFSKGSCFAKMRAQFRAIMECCKCVKDTATEEVPLLSDYSPSTPTSPEK